MPRIEELLVLPGLWVAFALNDFGEVRNKRIGFTRNHANSRTLRAVIKAST